MRIHRTGKRIYVQGVPSDTTWFCPYCCATVDKAFVTLRGTRSRMRSAVRVTHGQEERRLESSLPIG